MEPANLPGWIQEVTIFTVAVVSIVVGVYRYIKTEADKTSNKTLDQNTTGQVVAASFVDSKLLRELIDALREHQEEHGRVALRITRALSELREAMIENSESAKMQSDATLNMLRFIKTHTKGDIE